METGRAQSLWWGGLEWEQYTDLSGVVRCHHQEPSLPFSGPAAAAEFRALASHSPYKTAAVAR